MSTLSPIKVEPTGSKTALSEEDLSLIFEHTFKDGGWSKAHVLQGLESSLNDLCSQPQAEEHLRILAKASVLATARCHGNIIETARTILGHIDELGLHHQLDVRRAKEDFMLGLADGICQIGPIVYGRFLDIASEYRDNADEWIHDHRHQAPPLSFEPLPVIVPYEEDLTITAQPFKAAEPLPDDEAPQPLVQEAPPLKTEPASWSRPKGKGFFRRLSDVLGGLFQRP